ncbi:MAG: hypothetical protein ACYDEB_09410 [Dehalococcoidia bacterium]
MFESMKAKLLGAGAGLMLVGSAAGGAALLGITSTAAQTPPAVTQNAPANQTPDTAETAKAPEGANTAEANEVLPPGVVPHADADGVDVQHDFQGAE